MFLLHLGVLILPFTNTTVGGILPPLPPFPVRTIVVLTPSTLGNGLIPLLSSPTVLFTQSATSPPFSYGIPEFDSNSVLTYSTLHTMGMGVGISNTLVQGSNGGSSVPFNAIPYGGVHIPPPSPSLNGAF
jgi:hypothetical protein